MLTVKKSHWVNTGIVSAFIVLCVISCIAVFVLSAIQTQSRETTTAGSKLDAKDSDPCNNVKAFSDHRPVRFQVNGDPDDLYCGWKTTRTLLRMGISLLGFISSIFGFFCMIKKRKWSFYFFVILCLGFSLSFFASMCLDANDVRISNSWCENGIPDSDVTSPSGTLNPQVSCHEKLYIWTCGVDIICCFIWLGAMISGFRYARKRMNEEKEDPSSQPILSDDQLANK